MKESKFGAFLLAYEGQPEEGILMADQPYHQRWYHYRYYGFNRRGGIVSIPPGMVLASWKEICLRILKPPEILLYTATLRLCCVFHRLVAYIHLEDLKVIVGVDLYYGNGRVQVYDKEAGDYIDVNGDTIVIDENNFNQYIDPDNSLFKFYREETYM